MSKVTICNAVIGKCVKLEKTGIICEGKAVAEMEFDITKNRLCTVNSNESVVTDIANNVNYPVLKRDLDNRLSNDQSIEQDKEYVISIQDKEKINKVKLLYLRYKHKKDNKKSEF